jgi:hypothetical protein
MTLAELDRKLQERWIIWIILTTEERFRTCAGLYASEKVILERLAPTKYSEKDIMEFVFYHMHGVTPAESIEHVPDNLP